MRVSTVARIPLGQLNTPSDETMQEVSAVASGKLEATAFFAGREKSNTGWTPEHSRKRIIATKHLLQCDPRDFRICVKFDSQGVLTVVDGGHRLAVAHLLGADYIQVWLTTGQLWSRQTTNLPIIFGNPIVAIEKPPDDHR